MRRPLGGFGEGKRRERQIDRAQPRRRQSDQQADRAGQQRGERHSEDER
jgi:hypothetical protein